MKNNELQHEYLYGEQVKQRGHLYGKQANVQFAVGYTNDLLMRINKSRGSNEASYVFFFDKDYKTLHNVPLLNEPLQTYGRASMLLINSTTKANPDIQHVLYVSVIKFRDTKEKGTVAHFESREDSFITTDLLFKQDGLTPILQSSDFYAEITTGKPYNVFPIYGFFDDPETKIRNSERDVFLKDCAHQKDVKKLEKTMRKAYRKLFTYFLD
ncbi:hypothetical protein [Photobacterium kishitanii]|uniref:Uncharacterized protein n=1 Tax=Photobacterium kishitanii TaxID=318456 RepID=A0A2T3KL90_9GAMM|nr:hypothetical protein [Photobacterium kishitanii]PSV00485.1 hypothetical protein C9J27_04955 [Photobacterium kishitanii]